MHETAQTQYEVRNGAAWIYLNRPERLNALTALMVNQLYNHVQVAEKDDAVRVIVISGKGKAFCVGADLKNPPGAVSANDTMADMPDLLSAIMDSPKPVIAAVNGTAFAGGLGLIGAADLVVIDETAQCSFSEVRIGVIPAMIAVVCLPKLDRHQATRLFLTGERFDGKEAVTLGLAHKAVPAAKIPNAVDHYIEMVRLGGPHALAECKKLINQLQTLPRTEAFAQTARWSRALFASEEAQEGLSAFKEKRKPAWVIER